MLKSILTRIFFGVVTGNPDHDSFGHASVEAGHDSFDHATIDETPIDFAADHGGVNGGDLSANHDPFLQEHADVGASGPNGGPNNDPDFADGTLPLFRDIPKLSNVLAAHSNPDVGPSSPNGGPSNDPDRSIPSPEMRARIKRALDNM